MIKIERDPVVVAMERQAHQGLGEWAKDHLSEVISEIPYDPGNPNQWIDRVELPPKPSLAQARLLGSLSMGEEAYDNLLAEFDRINAVELARENASRGISTLFATLHLRDTLDTAISHNGLFVASNDNSFAEINVILANYIMSRMRIVGVDVDEALTTSGREIRALPDKAKDYIYSEIVSYMGRLATPVLTSALRSGVALHRAPSGKRADDIELLDGTIAKSVPKLSREAARTIRRRTPIAVGVPMDVKIGDSSAHVLEARRIDSETDLHRLMQDMTEVVSDLAGETVYYGLPKGARVIKRSGAKE